MTNPMSHASSPLSHFPLYFVVLFLAGGTAACADTQHPQDADPAMAAGARASIVDVLANDERFSTLAAALDSTGLADSLRGGGGPYTLFAPTNAAFEALPEGTVEELLRPAYRDRLRTILTYHVAEGAHPSDHMVSMAPLPTLAGSNLPVESANGTVTVGEATLIEADLKTGNGIVHVIDVVLLPPAGENGL